MQRKIVHVTFIRPTTSGRGVVAALVLAAAFTTAVPARGSPVAARNGSLTGAPQISRAYDTIFDARFDEVPAVLARTCPPAPAEVCTLLEIVNLWWQIQVDPDDTTRDRQFATGADAAIAAVDAWTRREPQRAEAWFYLGGAYGARAQWRVLRGQTIAAARDGKRIKQALERALSLDPALQDAYFGIGLYQYYADVAPAAAKFFRFFLALPGGDKVQGMKQMLRAREGGQVLRDEADYQLHLIALWYEKQPERALALLRGLHERHPRNPHFLEQIARVQDVYLHDRDASRRSWQALLDAAETGGVERSSAAAAAARLALAPWLDEAYETDRAIEYLRAVLTAQPPAPATLVARARQLLHRYDDRMNAPDDTARAYRLSLSGWRAFERGAVADASRLLNESLALRPADTVTRYRLARVLDAQQRDDAAIEMYESVLLSFDSTPPAFYAYACVDAARLYERRGDRARATELYQRAMPIFGAEQQTRDAAQRALARLRR